MYTNEERLFRAYIKPWMSSYWTDESSFFFLTSDQHEGGNLGPKLHPGGGFFGQLFFKILKKSLQRSI